MADPSHSDGNRSRSRRPGRGWRRPRTLIVTTIATGGLIAGGAVWAAGATTDSGYRMATVIRASVSKSLTVVGTVEPVSNASASFQVGGKVATLTAASGQQVTAGQSLATLDTAALTESVSSAQSTLSANEAKLTEDENAQSASAANTTTTTPHTTPTTSPTNAPANATDAATITQDQNTLTTDQSATSTDQQQEAADLVAAQAACGTTGSTGTTSTTSTTSTTTTTPASGSSAAAACTAALQKVSDNQHQVSTDQATVAKDESALAKALGDTGSSAPTGSGGGQTSHALSAGNTSPSQSTPSSSGNGPSNSNSPSSSAASDTPQQIATDQAAIDSARATLIDAQQSLNEAQLTSPINGTIVSIGIAVGDTVSAGSSTAVIVIIGTQAFQVAGTLSSTQVAGLKIGDGADVAVDGLTSAAHGTISQVGPVQSSSTGYTYPVVVALPSSVKGLFAGSSANVTVATGQVTDVVAVPTSAVLTQGSNSYVEMLKNGSLTRKVIKTGMVGEVYTEVHSGLTPGESVVLADLSQAVPSSNTASLGGFGGGGFGGGGFGGGGRFQQIIGGTGAGGGKAPVSVGG